MLKSKIVWKVKAKFKRKKGRKAPGIQHFLLSLRNFAKDLILSWYVRFNNDDFVHLPDQS